MFDRKLIKKLNDYYKVKDRNSSIEVKILKHKYENTYLELKYLFTSLFTLGYDNYEFELDSILNEIEIHENVLIAILDELIYLNSK
jgi:hypothetical protein